MAASEIFKRPRYDWVVWESPLSALVRDVYGKPGFSLQAMWEASQHTYHAYDVRWGESDAEWERYARQELDLWTSGRAADVDTDVLFWDMLHKGVVPAGLWLVQVWW